jgi:hypothetical protein
METNASMTCQGWTRTDPPPPAAVASGGGLGGELGAANWQLALRFLGPPPPAVALAKAGINRIQEESHALKGLKYISHGHPPMVAAKTWS